MSLGCAIIRSPLTCPEQGGPAWTEIVSPNFVLTTDVEPTIARARAAEFEEMHATLAHVMGRRQGAQSTRVSIVLFERKEDFSKIEGDTGAAMAFFTQQPPGDLEPRPLIVMYGERLADDTRETFQHELAHRFLHEGFAVLPGWLDEGFAEYYSTVRVENGRVIMGAAGSKDFSERPHFWSSWRGRSTQSQSQLQIPLRLAPSLWDLIHADRTTFRPGKEEGTASRKQLEQQAVFYGAAWKLVHYFKNGPSDGDTERFSVFLEAAARGERPRDAFLETFGGDFARLAGAFQRYLREERLDLRIAPAPPVAAAGTLAARALTDAEVHLLWAGISRMTKSGVARARRDLDEALARDPRSPEVYFRRSVFFLRRGLLEEAQRDLDAALAARADEPRYLYARLVLQWERGLASDHRGESRTTAEHLARVAVSADQLQLAGAYLARAGNVAEGLRLVERAVTMDLLCSACERTRAMLLAKLGRYDEALAATERAIALLPESATIEGLLRLRSSIVKARSSKPRSPEGKGPTGAADAQGGHHRL